MKVRVLTAHPIAAASVDHLHPRGTKNDNSKNLAFNQKLRAIYEPERFSVLDLGCSGGGFVASLIAEGILAVGLEGSDYSKRNRRAAWAEVPEFLFTADITQPFEVFYLGTHDPRAVSAIFDVVTAWEVLEHLTEEGLAGMLENVNAHTKVGSLFIASVATASDRYEGIEYHATVQGEAWWALWMQSHGWDRRIDWEAYFAPHWVRGPNTEGPTSVCFVWKKR